MYYPIPPSGQAIEYMAKYSQNPLHNLHINCHPSGSFSAYHTHDFYEINYVLKGHCINRINGEEFLLSHGDAALLHPTSYHSLCANEESVVINLLVRPSFFLSSMRSAEEGSPLATFVAKAENDEPYRYLLLTGGQSSDEPLRRLTEAFNRQGPMAILVTEAQFILFMACLANGQKSYRLSPDCSSVSFTFTQILSHMNNHYATVTFDELADIFGYSKTHLCRLFRRYTGQSYTALITDIRLAHALYFLSHTDQKVKDIAASCGFVSIEHFHRLFSKRFSKTPLHYRKSAKNA